MNNRIVENIPRPRHTRPADPQIVVNGRLREGDNGGEYIVFRLPLGLFVLVFIVNIPGEGESTAPVYCKFKVDRPRREDRGGSAEPAEGEEE